MEQLLEQADNPYKNWVADDEQNIAFFKMQDIGGKLSFLDEATLNKLANYLSSGATMTLTEGVDEEQLPGVIILQDAYAEHWNTIALELAKGLVKSGIQVVYGEFQDSLRTVDLMDKHLPAYKEDKFSCPKTCYLSDLAQYKETHILLVFSNGQGLIASRGVEARKLMAQWPRVRIVSSIEVEAMSLISQWPKVAWLELREPRSWDEGTNLPLEYSIPVYPATAKCLDKIFLQFFVKQQSLKVYKLHMNYKKISSYEGRQIDEQGNVDEKFAGYVERFLGNSISWARACAVLQPLSLALADKLRKRFFADLPQRRLERLVGLPNTSRTIWGLMFSEPVKQVLRGQFLRCVDEQSRETILRFILEEMENPKIKPLEKVDGKYTLAYLNWKCMHELLRVNIGSERESAKKELDLLLDTPLNSFIMRFK